MRRKYLDDIGVHNRWDQLGKHSKPKKRRLWKRQRKIYGFDERETWNLNDTFYYWLYERLNLFLEKAGEIIDLDYPRFEYNGQKYTQRQMINMMLERLEVLFNAHTPESDYVLEIGEIWAVVLPAMWW